jgi:hypothetical protein
MARRNPKIIELEEKLRKEKLRADNNGELHQRALGKLEKYEEKDEEESRLVRDMRRRDDEYRQQLEDQVSWMRRLLEHMCLPPEKLELFEKFRQETLSAGDPIGYPQRRY